MTLHRAVLEVGTDGHGEIVDLTPSVAEAVRAAGVADGQVGVFAVGSTVAVTTMEYEPGGVRDLSDVLERLVPAGAAYEHNRLNGDSNAHAHVRAALIGPSESIPLSGGRLALGTWQQLVLLDFDDRPRRRRVLVDVLG